MSQDQQSSYETPMDEEGRKDSGRKKGGARRTSEAKRSAGEKHPGDERSKNDERRRKAAAKKAAREREVRRQMMIIGGVTAGVLLIIILAALFLKKPAAESTEDVVTEETAEVTTEAGTAAETAEAGTAEVEDGMNTVDPVAIEAEATPAAGTETVTPSAGTETAAATPAPTAEATSTRPADLPDIDVTSWEFILANADHPIGDYTPETVLVENDQYVDYRIYDAMTAFIADCRAAGNTVYLSSAYRSYETQDYLFQRKVEQYGSEEEAARIVLPPGTSEHQTGLSADITEEYYEVKNRELENTAMYQWMAAHCQEYGFIVRYPDGKEDITDIIYEPWHFRYVGVEAATYIMEHGITLEEFLAYYE